MRARGPEAVLIWRSVGLAALTIAFSSACSRSPQVSSKAAEDSGVPRAACALEDSDRDGLPDAWELSKYRTNPLSSDSDGDGTPDADWLERREFTYTIAAELEVGFEVGDAGQLNTLFQDVRILGRRAGLTLLEVVLYPGAEAAAGVEKYQERASCLPFGPMRPEGSANFVEEMMALAGDAGTQAERTATLLEAVFRQTRREVPFNAFYLRKAGEGVAVEPLARTAVTDLALDAGELWARELSAPVMWERRARGECTSSAVLGQAALGAIGVPARLALFVPLSQAPEAVLQGVWDSRGLAGQTPVRGAKTKCVSHTVEEFVSEGRWLHGDEGRVRSSPFELGLGPVVQLRTAPAIDSLVEPASWGAACAGLGPLDGTRNVYRFVRATDGWGPHVSSDGLERLGLRPPKTVRLADVFPFESLKRPREIPSSAVSDSARYYLARAEGDGGHIAGIDYFYRCADKVLLPFRFVRGYWGSHFLLEKLDGYETTEPFSTTCRSECCWQVVDSNFSD